MWQRGEFVSQPHSAVLADTFQIASFVYETACWLDFLVPLRRGDLNSPPWHVYWRPGVTNCVGPACGFAALKYIPYPAQVLVKSSKVIPVMVMGKLLHGVHYAPVEYFFCGLVVAGVSLFASRSPKSELRLASPNTPLGYTLCFANLVLDGYTNSAQDEINKRYRGGNSVQMMCWMNFWTGVIYIPLLFLFSSAGKDVVLFCMKHPEAARQLMLFCLCGAVGQLFIFYTIRNFGSLTTTLITTTRKFFSILASVLWSGNALSAQQWLAVVLVFSGLISKSLWKHFGKSHRIGQARSHQA